MLSPTTNLNDRIALTLKIALTFWRFLVTSSQYPGISALNPCKLCIFYADDN